MYKGKIAAAAAVLVLFMSSSFTGCEGDEFSDSLGAQLGDSVKEAVSDVKRQVSDDIKSAFVSEVKAYLASDEMAESLGISSQEQENIIDSVRDYVDNYEFDTEQMKEAKETVEAFIRNAEGLSADEIKENIQEILENNKVE